LARKLLRLVLALQRTVKDLSLLDTDRPSKAQSASSELARISAEMEPGLQSLQNYLAARKDFTARRNSREAALNRDIATAYELQVHRASAESERHRERSQQFFIGMLFAQAAAAVAALALAVRTKTLLWGVAFAAGTIAVVFSAYVYLTM